MSLCLVLTRACQEPTVWMNHVQVYWITSQCVWEQSEGGQLNILNCNIEVYGQVHCPTQSDNSPRWPRNCPVTKQKDSPPGTPPPTVPVLVAFATVIKIPRLRQPVEGRFISAHGYEGESIMAGEVEQVSWAGCSCLVPVCLCMQEARRAN